MNKVDTYVFYADEDIDKSLQHEMKWKENRTEVGNSLHKSIKDQLIESNEIELGGLGSMTTVFYIKTSECLEGLKCEMTPLNIIKRKLTKQEIIDFGNSIFI